MRQIIGVLFSKLHATPSLLPIYNFFLITRLHRLGHIIFDFFESLSPSDEMKIGRIIFQEHKRELNAVYKMLSDAKSKDVYKNTIFFRITKKRKYLKNIIDKDAYFVKELIPKNSAEVFIDCGAFDGDTLKEYLQFNEKYKKIVLFEPTAKNLARIKEFGEKKELKNIYYIEAGVGEKSEKANFSDNGTATASVAKDGDIQIQIYALDDIEKCKDATFIKMDIEGNELSALKGAKNIIVKNKPKLAICIYHKPQDYYEIPLYLKKLVPEYKFYVRHHSYCYAETVLYAICK